MAEVLEAKKQKLTDQQTEDLAKYKGFKDRTSQQGVIKAAVKDEKTLQSRNYLTIFNYYKPINMTIESSVLYEDYWYDILLFLFIGMALYKSGFLLGKNSTSVYAAVAFIGITVGLLINYIYAKQQYQLKFDQFQFTQKWKFSYYEIRRVFQTTGYLSLLILLYKAIPFRKILNVFAPVGQMAFTNYLSQSIITSIVFYGFAVYGTLQRYEVYYVVGAIWLFQIVSSHIWLRYFRFGPFEWVWRSLTYLKKQPMRKRIELAELEEKINEEPVAVLA